MRLGAVEVKGWRQGWGPAGGGRLRLGAMRRIGLHIQHALLPLTEVRRILRLRPCRQPPPAGWMTGWLTGCFKSLWGHFGIGFEAYGVTLETIWTGLGGSWGPLCSHWMPVGYFRGLRDHFLGAWAPIWESWELLGFIFRSVGVILGAPGT